MRALVASCIVLAGCCHEPQPGNAVHFATEPPPPNGAATEPAVAPSRIVIPVFLDEKQLRDRLDHALHEGGTGDLDLEFVLLHYRWAATIGPVEVAGDRVKASVDVSVDFGDRKPVVNPHPLAD